MTRRDNIHTHFEHALNYLKLTRTDVLNKSKRNSHCREKVACFLHKLGYKPSEIAPILDVRRQTVMYYISAEVRAYRLKEAAKSKRRITQSKRRYELIKRMRVTLQDAGYDTQDIRLAFGINLTKM